MVLISFVIPAYNEEKLLDRCIDSIHREASRYNIVYNVIVVDNDSSDHTVQVARQHFAVVIPEKRPGVTFARNTGYQAAKTSEFIAFVDADSILPTGWLKGALAALDDDTVMVTGPLVYHEWGPFKRALCRYFYAIGRLCHRFVGPMCQGGNFVARRSAMDAIGGYPTDVDFYGEDTDFAKKIAKVGKTKVVQEMWVWSSARRMEGQGMITTTWLYAINYFSITLFNRPVSLKHQDYR